MNIVEPALNWAGAAGADRAAVRQAWEAGRAADVPVGRLWDVLRVTAAVGRDVISGLTERGIQLGPVLDVPPRGVVEFIVERGGGPIWPELYGTVWAASGHMRWPSPHATRRANRRAECRRSWIVPPVFTVPPVTPADWLCEAVVASLVHHVHVGERLIAEAHTKV